MASPYDHPEARDDRPPRITILTVIAVAFALFMVWQVNQTIGDSRERIEADTVQAGDRIEYHFEARLPDGTLWSTSRLEVAEAANATEGHPLQPAFNYAVKRATIDPAAPGLGWGPEADRAVLGAFVGQTVRFTVQSGGTGAWEPFTPGQAGIPREILPQSFQRTSFLQEPAAAQAEGNTGSPGFNLTQLAAQLEPQVGELETGAVYNADRVFPPSWDIEFVDVNWDNRSITFRHTVQDGQGFDVPGLPGQVVVVISDDESELAYRLDFPEGATFVVQPGTELNQAGFSPGSYLVNATTDEYVELLYHSSFRPDAVGQPLTVRLTVLSKNAAAAPAGTAGDGHTDHTH